MQNDGDQGGPGAHRAPADDPLVIGPIILARHDPAVRVEPRRRGDASNDEFVALYFDVEREGGASPAADDPRACIALLAPRRYLAGLLPPGAELRRPPRSAGLRMLQRYLDGLLDLDRERMCERQKALAASAVRSLLAAALSPAQVAQGGLRSRRRDALIDRVTSHIDAHLDEDLTVDSLCSALGCSRAVLYRATTEAGGAAELILRRRLLAIRERLQDRDERRSIAAIADAYGFSDVVHLNRRFKALFGAPPGEMRRGRLLVAPSRPAARTPRGAARPPARRLPCR